MKSVDVGKLKGGNFPRGKKKGQPPNRGKIGAGAKLLPKDEKLSLVGCIRIWGKKVGCIR